MGPLIRIALRYAASALIAKGYFSQEDSSLFDSPELQSVIEMGVGFAIALATEYWYRLAIKLGWAK